MKRRYVAIIILVTLSISLSINLSIGTSYSADTNAHVIYSVSWLSDTSARVTLKWSDDKMTTPIMIAGWSVDSSGIVTITYRQGSSVVEGFNKRTIESPSIKVPCIILLKEDVSSSEETKAIFPDLPKDLLTVKAIEHLYYRGIINGYTDGTFKPLGNVSRAEFSKMLFLGGELEINLESPIDFSDVTNAHWAKNYIYTLAAKGIVNGKGNSKFDPSGTITIGEVLAIIDRSFLLYNSLGNYTFDLSNHWSNEHFVSLVDKGIIKSTDSFYYPYTPNRVATREECALLLSRVLLQFHEIK